jgi:(1->4)-alpha-D-glucan 1-alpha-D-glucosylmutase
MDGCLQTVMRVNWHTAGVTSLKPPTATYRVQLNSDFGFAQLKDAVPYLAELGVSHIYASPIFQAKKASTHGYDAVDPNKISSELGGAEAFDDLCREAASYGLEWLQDIVPNHVAYTPENPMIWDVMQRGSSSKFYGFLDVDWNHPSPQLKGKVLAPFLDQKHETCLRGGDIQLAYKEGFVLSYKGTDFPVTLDSHGEILSSSTENPAAIEQALKTYNSNPQLLDKLVSKQVFALTYWRRALRELNYRRFFDITDLICLRIEEKQVFETVHRLVFELMAEGKVGGARIDHVDGLHDPQEYIERFRQKTPNVYTIVEKILTAQEELPCSWHVQGTTGYDFLNHTNQLFVDTENQTKFDTLYAQFSENNEPFSQLLYQCKKQVIEMSFSGDMDNLARLMLAELQNWKFGRDVEPPKLKEALVEVFACFSVYRAYLSPKNRDKKAQEPFAAALTLARQKNANVNCEFSAISSLLRECEWSEGALAVFMRLQQFTGAVMAKGFEDSALYRYVRLLSLNEVGGDPSKFGCSPEEFHEFNMARQKNWPHTLNASSTHDTKRGEDARARLNVLSELPQEFSVRLQKWAALNHPLKKETAGKLAPSPNEEYYLYQTLLAAYPFAEADMPQFRQRLKTHIPKALREAKVHSNWLDPNVKYEAAVSEFVDTLFEGEQAGEFREDFLPFQNKISNFGVFNSLSQTLLKITCPGIPDFYQGAELWDLNMVDPDNRRPINFQQRQKLLAEIQKTEPAKATKLLEDPIDGKAKLYLIFRALAARKRRRELFEQGTYVPLVVKGRFSRHVIAFCRIKGSLCAVTAVPRFLASLPRREGKAGFDWQDTVVFLPDSEVKAWVNVFTKEKIVPHQVSGRAVLRVSDLLERFPVALLLSEEST